LTRPSGEVLTWLLLPKRVFKRQFLYVWKSFCKVGLCQSLCIDWLLAWNVVSSGVRLSSVTRLRSRHLGTCVRGPPVLYPKQSLKQSLAAQPPQRPTDHLVYSDGPSPLLSGKISTSSSLPLLSLWLLTPQSRRLSPSLSFVLHLTSPARPSVILYNPAPAPSRSTTHPL